MPPSLSSTRNSQIWEYIVSHGQLLIRSPKSPGTAKDPAQVTNLDLAFYAVNYMGLPTYLRGIELVEASPQEVEALSGLLGRSLKAEEIYVLLSGAKRFPVVAGNLVINENDWEIFEIPFRLRANSRKLTDDLSLASCKETRPIFGVG